MFLVYEFLLIQNYNLIWSNCFQICQFMVDRWVLLNELYLDFGLKEPLPNNLLLLTRCWISRYVFPPYASGITANGDSTHVTWHWMQVREGVAFFKLPDFFSGLQVWLVSLELCNNCFETLLLLTIESVDLFQDRYTFFFDFEFTTFEIFRNSVCKNDI